MQTKLTIGPDMFLRIYEDMNLIIFALIASKTTFQKKKQKTLKSLDRRDCDSNFATTQLENLYSYNSSGEKAIEPNHEEIRDKFLQKLRRKNQVIIIRMHFLFPHQPNTVKEPTMQTSKTIVQYVKLGELIFQEVIVNLDVNSLQSCGFFSSQVLVKMQSLFGGNNSQNESDWNFSEIKDEVKREFPMEKQKRENIKLQQVEISEPKQQAHDEDDEKTEQKSAEPQTKKRKLSSSKK